MMLRGTAMLFVLALGSTFVFAEPERKKFQVFEDIQRQVNQYGYFTIFDDVKATIDEQGVVEVAQYNVKATGHVAKLRRDLGLDA